jgi:hypothetical protein
MVNKQLNRKQEKPLQTVSMTTEEEIREII